MRIDRRRFLAGAGALTLGALAGCGFGAPTPNVRLSAGERGGLYYAFAGLLAAAGGTTVRIEPLTTAGSRENLDLLAAGDVDAALTLADSVRPDDDVTALGRVYENYLQLVVPAGSPIGSVADLRGRRVNLGALGSGAALTGERLLLVTARSSARAAATRRAARAAQRRCSKRLGAAQGQHGVRTTSPSTSTRTPRRRSTKRFPYEQIPGAAAPGNAIIDDGSLNAATAARAGRRARQRAATRRTS